MHQFMLSFAERCNSCFYEVLKCDLETSPRAERVQNASDLTWLDSGDRDYTHGGDTVRMIFEVTRVIACGLRMCCILMYLNWFQILALKTPARAWVRVDLQQNPPGTSWHFLDMLVIETLHT